MLGNPHVGTRVQTSGPSGKLKVAREARSDLGDWAMMLVGPP